METHFRLSARVTTRGPGELTSDTRCLFTGRSALIVGSSLTDPPLIHALLTARDQTAYRDVTKRFVIRPLQGMAVTALGGEASAGLLKLRTGAGGAPRRRTLVSAVLLSSTPDGRGSSSQSHARRSRDEVLRHQRAPQVRASPRGLVGELGRAGQPFPGGRAARGAQFPSPHGFAGDTADNQLSDGRETQAGGMATLGAGTPATRAVGVVHGDVARPSLDPNRRH